MNRRCFFFTATIFYGLLLFIDWLRVQYDWRLYIHEHILITMFVFNTQEWMVCLCIQNWWYTPIITKMVRRSRSQTHFKPNTTIDIRNQKSKNRYRFIHTTHTRNRTKNEWNSYRIPDNVLFFFYSVSQPNATQCMNWIHFRCVYIVNTFS